jgi:RES domain
MSGPARRVHDRSVLDILEAIGTQSLSGRVWRITRKGRDATRGSTAGGRWSPIGEFEVLYTSLEKDGALAEIGHRLSLEPVWPSKLVHELHNLAFGVERALRLPDLGTLRSLGVNTERYESYDYTATQAIAAAAQFLGYDALIVPNARHPSLNLVVLAENLNPAGALEVLSSERVDWSAWRRRTRTAIRSTRARDTTRQNRKRRSVLRLRRRVDAPFELPHLGALRRSRKSPMRSSARLILGVELA